ncbi:MAG: hypothetical protein RL173_20 [Fibrobacterota bacterium]|jgi:hypothetical protein
MALKLVCLLAAIAVARPDWLGPEGSAVDGSSNEATHEGFFFRAGLGGIPMAPASVDINSTGHSSLGNAATLVRVQMGGSLVPRFAVHLSLIDALVTYQSEFQSLTFGAGFSWYSKENYFVTSSMGYLVGSDKFGNGQGYRLSIGLGKEFMVSEFSGLGAMITWEQVKWSDPDQSLYWHAMGPGFQLTWTYN